MLLQRRQDLLGVGAQRRVRAVLRVGLGHADRHLVRLDLLADVEAVEAQAGRGGRKLGEHRLLLLVRGDHGAGTGVLHHCAAAEAAAGRRALRRAVAHALEAADRAARQGAAHGARRGTEARADRTAGDGERSADQATDRAAIGHRAHGAGRAARQGHVGGPVVTERILGVGTDPRVAGLLQGDLRRLHLEGVRLHRLHAEVVHLGEGGGGQGQDHRGGDNGILQHRRTS